VGRDEWRYIVPRPFLDGLAGTRTLGRSTQVLVALICKMYGDQENAGSETPAATVTLSSLVKMTGRGVREVQKSLTILYRAGVLVDVDAKPGRAKVLRLNPGPKEPTPETGQGRQKGHGSGAESGVGPVPNRAWVPTPKMGHTHKEQEKTSLKEPLSRTVDVANVDRMHSTNGHGQVMVSETIEVARPNAIRMVLVSAITNSAFCRRAVKDRWLLLAKELSHDLIDRDDLSESTIRRRAAEFFATEFWCNTCDSHQVTHLRRHMLKPVPKRKSASKR
jgi:hypothetical protein